ncbi:MAG: 50S ribosomal protein L4 [Candidatus Doudnabacteria bacterium RIFCSPLOWO2_01_FULL_44_21]|uniref:Large ribosomal subunit protein uL4 n=1 Tax=Candidatus Doudnabacteria bacterium RIFCSPLOWO2_01_FULL_44_21 TaxID=1817841 RepID=A0A1F5PY90_9BACT|nr:ribosomal protein L4 [uncultured bacterium]OGE83547.1 MAG: 50S ribosomal protein L4 [Candidatus Doudnabacteria bacterium RIFCSPHIGHO2_02_FULL_43_13b]OGE94807.1 MAG: 50S ribosomal protein L4 [Candidatus Doudnabacteria bacterium RIFCSPLOWO2_01_FULL_44_21]
MLKVNVYNQAGEKVSDLDLNPKIFGLEKIDANLVHAAVRTQRNNIRGPWAHTKMMGEVSGSGKKPWKQKGTGRARVGSIRSPLWRGGGITFGPRKNRDWSLKLNQKVLHKALFTILSDKLNDKKLIIVDQINEAAKTKELANRLRDLANKAGLGKKYILIIPTHNKNLEKAARNLENVKVLSAKQLNVLDLLRYDVIILKEALPVIEQTYGIL